MKITSYNSRLEGEFIIFTPVIEDVENEILKIAYRIINTVKIHIKLWDEVVACILEDWIVDKAIDETKIYGEIDKLKTEIRNLKERSIN